MAHSPSAIGTIIVDRVRLSACEGKIESPIVYSTNPQLGVSNKGIRYVTKGDEDIRIVFAEVAGHLLAKIFEIPVPAFAVATYSEDGPTVFGSEFIEDAVRDVEPWLITENVTNFECLVKTIVFDVWIANKDRNIGNFIGRPISQKESKIELVAIDFEKSACVRDEYPITNIPNTPPQNFWPSGSLGKLCHQKLTIEKIYIDEIQSITDGAIQNVLDTSIAATGISATVKESAEYVLLHRRDNLNKLVQEVWPK